MDSSRSKAALAVVLMVGVLMAGIASAQKIPLGLLPIQWPADNPCSAAKADLGRLLYFDKRTPNKNLDEKIKKLNLSAGEKKDLVDFLKALEGAPIIVAVPTSFPQ